MLPQREHLTLFRVRTPYAIVRDGTENLMEQSVLYSFTYYRWTENSIDETKDARFYCRAIILALQ